MPAIVKETSAVADLRETHSIANHDAGPLPRVALSQVFGGSHHFSD